VPAGRFAAAAAAPGSSSPASRLPPGGHPEKQGGKASVCPPANGNQREKDIHTVCSLASCGYSQRTRTATALYYGRASRGASTRLRASPCTVAQKSRQLPRCEILLSNKKTTAASLKNNKATSVGRCFEKKQMPTAEIFRHSTKCLGRRCLRSAAHYTHDRQPQQCFLHLGSALLADASARARRQWEGIEGTATSVRARLKNKRSRVGWEDEKR